MKKLILVVILMLCVVMLSTIVAQAFSMPAVCAYAGYGPQWMWQCLVAIAMELWIDPMDLLD